MTSQAAGLICGILALYLWPAVNRRLRPVSGVKRVAAIGRRQLRVRSFGQESGNVSTSVQLVFILGLLVAGWAMGVITIGVSVALAVVWRTGVALYRRSKTHQARQAEQAEIRFVIQGLARELQGGSTLLTAAAAIGPVTGLVGGAFLEGISKATRFGRMEMFDSQSFGELGRRFETAWRLSHQYGIGIAKLIDDMASELDMSLAAERKRTALLAGPKLSGYLLAGLPLIGIALGTSMGAQPVRVLSATGIGQILLVAGVSLVCVGLLWISRLIQ